MGVGTLDVEVASSVVVGEAVSVGSAVVGADDVVTSVEVGTSDAVVSVTWAEVDGVSTAEVSEATAVEVSGSREAVLDISLVVDSTSEVIVVSTVAVSVVDVHGSTVV